MGATISINRIPFYDGVDIGDASTKMVNGGLINIGNIQPIAQDGFNIYAGGMFQNEPTGIVNIANTNLSALRIDGAARIFQNKGSVNAVP
ncbi:MAG: hypothetical protein IPM42_02410 [Saprospiraceae bacterium]|nr:hypothetical protein [Saprospiraceae bacterium]